MINQFCIYNTTQCRTWIEISLQSIQKSVTLSTIPGQTDKPNNDLVAGVAVSVIVLLLSYSCLHYCHGQLVEVGH